MFKVVLKIGKLTKIKEFADFALASKEFETLKRMNSNVVLMKDDVDISSTVIEQAPKKEAIEKIASAVEIDVIFAYKEGDVKKAIKVKESRAKVLLHRAEKAGYQACILVNKQVIAKVNC